MMMDDRLLVTVEAAAQRLGLSRGTVYPLVLSGDIPSIKIGRARRIPVDELEAWIEPVSYTHLTLPTPPYV